MAVVDIWSQVADAWEARHRPHPDLARWVVDPVAFVAEAFRWKAGEGLTEYQAEALSTLAQDRRVAMRSLHGAGKTSTGALAVLWFSVTREMQALDWKVVTTASAWRQLTRYLWPEIHKWARRLDWDRLGIEPWRDGRELGDQQIKLGHGSAFAVASKDASLIEGAHASQLLYLADEAKAVPAKTFDAIEGAFAGAGEDTTDEAFALASSTPAQPLGRFYEICARRPGTEDWKAIHVSLERAILAGRVSREWAEQRARQWGETSALFRNRVLGEFASDETDGVIPLSWVEAAVERWERPEGQTTAGFDPVREGSDVAVLQLLAGLVAHEPIDLGAGDGPTLAQRAAGHLGEGVTVMVDSDGVGASPFDALRALLGRRVHPFHGGGPAPPGHTDSTGELTFANLRAAAWWNARELFDPSKESGIAIPYHDLLVGDLVAPTWKIRPNGSILIEAKEDIKKRLGRSPDNGDALVYALWAIQERAGSAATLGRATKRRIEVRH